MVATDTVVGIVGAVLLVAVMAGVFVYEFNNAPEGAESEAHKQAHFEEDYAGLSALDDIDGDGNANYNDTDFDGDGVDNAEDDMVMRTLSVTGNVGMATPVASPTFRFDFDVGNGSEHLSGALTYSRITATPALPTLQATITGPGGFSCNATPTASGTQATLTFDCADQIPAKGTYTLTVSHVPLAGPLTLAPEADVLGTLDVHYASPEGGGHSH